MKVWKVAAVGIDAAACAFTARAIRRYGEDKRTGVLDARSYFKYRKMDQQSGRPISPADPDATMDWDSQMKRDRYAVHSYFAGEEK